MPLQDAVPNAADMVRLEIAAVLPRSQAEYLRRVIAAVGGTTERWFVAVVNPDSQGSQPYPPPSAEQSADRAS